DHTFTNKTWHEVTHLSLPRLTALEQRALECFNYSLGVSNEDWRAWLGVLKEGAQGALASSPAPIPMSTLAIQVMDRLEKELEVLVGGVGAGVVDVMSMGGKGVIGDRRGSMSTTAPSVPAISTNVPVPVSAPASATEMELDELEMQQVEIDIDLDDGGPVPEELRRPVKVRLGAGGEVQEEDMWAKGKDAWGKEGGKDVWKEEGVWKSGKEMNWGKTQESWGKAKQASWGKAKTWRHKGDTWHFMEEDQDEWERAIRAAGVMDDHHDWPNPVGNELRNRNLSARPRVQVYGHGGYAYPDYSYPYPDYSTSYQGYDGIGRGAYEYPTNGVYYAPAYEAVPCDYEAGCVYDGGAHNYHYGCPRQVPVPTWTQKSSGCVLG
ncbi:hypothetical protein RSAG8_08124, partial [Rhizoctonia solani AG-8 WAC10335]